MYINHFHTKSVWALWLRRLGWLGLLFFLVKGVLWLSLPLLLMVFGMGY